MSRDIAQLSCLQCSKRKIKCNKAVPCSGCIDSGFDCSPVQRKRKPRGRSSKTIVRDGNLKTRIAQLEDAVAQLKHARGDVKTDGERRSNATSLQAIAADFWENLTGTVEDIRDLLDGENEDDNQSVEQPSPASTLSFFTSTRSGSVSEHVTLSSQLQPWLLSVYAVRFDPLLKVIDIDSVTSTWQSEPRDEQALLQTAVLFAAAITLMPYELGDMDGLVSGLQRELEQRLNEAKFVTSRSFVVLQAFVLYLAGLRATRAHAQQWALLPLAIRLASTHGMPEVLDNDIGKQNQLRLRVWFSLGMLDLQSSFDRGSKPLMSLADFQVLPPDDSTIRGFTGMTTSLLTCQAMLCQRRLLHRFSSGAQMTQMQYPQHNGILDDFEAYVQRIAPLCADPTDALQAFTMVIARESLLTMKLLLHRPLQKSARPNVDSIDVLQSAIVVLQSAEYKTRAEFVQWAWYAWVKWYVLAIVLAELCRETVPWNEQALEAWQLADTAFEKYAKLVSDTEGGLLWNPIAKLYRRVKGIAHSQSIAAMSETITLDDIGLGDVNWQAWDTFLDDMIDPALLLDTEIPVLS